MIIALPSAMVCVQIGLVPRRIHPTGELITSGLPILRQMGAVAGIAGRSASRLQTAVGTTLTSRNSPSALQEHAVPLQLRASAAAKLASVVEPLSASAPVPAIEAQGLLKGSRRRGRPKRWSRWHGRRDPPLRSYRRSLAPREKPVRPQSCESSIAGAPEGKTRSWPLRQDGVGTKLGTARMSAPSCPCEKRNNRSKLNQLVTTRP